MVLTDEKRKEEVEKRVTAAGSRAAAEEVAGGRRGRAVQREGLLGSLPVPESPDRACRACCTGRNRRDCSP